MTFALVMLAKASLVLEPSDKGEGSVILSVIGQAADLSDKIIDTGNGEELGPMMQTVVYGKLKTFA